jgi:uncharacterized ferritin-like protein (DUF455 family)
VESLRDYCRSILEGPSLEDKLRPAPELTLARGAPLDIDAPARADDLRMREGSDRLPKLGALKDPSARAVCLARFAHHELLAVELLAWALLALDVPDALARGLLHTLAEEQTHLRLYLDRLDGHGSAITEHARSDYLWRATRGIRDASDPLAAFLCAVGLTFEQANLDYSLLYRDAFRAAGDDESARALQTVHDDEVGHVRLAATWLKKRGELTDLYQAHVPFPLQAARAKARRFDVKARERAGLDPDFVAFIRAARPAHQN